MPGACNFIKKEALTQVFSCEFYEIFKNTFFTEHLRTIASGTENLSEVFQKTNCKSLTCNFTANDLKHVSFLFLFMKGLIQSVFKQIYK